MFVIRRAGHPPTLVEGLTTALTKTTGYTVQAVSEPGEVETLPHDMVAFSVTSASGGVTLTGTMPAVATLTYTIDPEPQPVISVPPGDHGPVTVLTKSPAQSLDGSGRVISGSQLNPGRATETVTSVLQGLDGRAGSVAFTANAYFSAPLSAAFPLQLAAGDILIATASSTTVTAARHGVFDDVLALTVREGAAPAANVMAPKVARTALAVLSLNGPFDIAAIEATLPRHDASATGPLTDFDPYLAKLSRFDPFPAMARGPATPTHAGYETFSRRAMGSAGANYGQNRAAVVSGVLPLLYLDVGSQAQRERAVAAALSIGAQLDDVPFGSDGGHHQWSLPFVAFYRKIAGLAPVPLTDRVAANHGQFYLETTATIAELTTPHSDSAKFQTSYLREVLAVGADTVTVAWGSGKWNFVGLDLVNEAGTKTGRITAPTSISPPNGNTTLVFTLSGVHAFAVGEKVWMRAPWVISEGDPAWHLNWNRANSAGVGVGVDFRNTNNPAVGAAYRAISRPADFVPFAEALRIWHPSYEALWRYVERVVAGGYPAPDQQYIQPFMVESLTLDGGGLQSPTDTWGLRIYQQLWSEITYAKT